MLLTTCLIRNSFSPINVGESDLLRKVDMIVLEKNGVKGRRINKQTNKQKVRTSFGLMRDVSWIFLYGDTTRLRTLKDKTSK